MKEKAKDVPEAGADKDDEGSRERNQQVCLLTI